VSPYKKTFALASIIATLLLLLYAQYSEKSVEIPPLSLGDIVFRTQDGFGSDIARIASTSDHRFSHVGIVCEESPIKICHASLVDGEVVKDTAMSFFENATDFGIYKTKSPAIAVAKARSLIGTPFDHDYDSLDHSRLYCSEYIAESIVESVPLIRLANKPIISIDSLQAVLIQSKS